MMEFLSAHSHTEYSNVRFLDSTIKVADLVDRAVKLGFRGIAVTDHECLSGAVKLLKVRDRVRKDHPDFKVVFGNEIYLIDESEVRNTSRYYHFILLAKDAIGWQQLKELSSRAWERGYVDRGLMRVPTTYQDIEEVVGKDPRHLIASTACLGGRLDISILNGDTESVDSFLEWGISTFGKDDFYLEMQVANTEEQIRCNREIIDLSSRYGLKYIFTTDTHYLEKGDFGIHSAFLNSRQSSDRETEKFYRYTYMMSIDEMVELLTEMGHTPDEISTGIGNTMSIYNSISDFDFRCNTIVPHTRIPEFSFCGLLDSYLSKNGRDRYPNIAAFMGSGNIQDRYLAYLIEQGVREKGIVLGDTELSRIDTELSVVSKVSKGLNQTVSSYFLLMREVIDIAWKYSFVGPGRGSSTGFYINYLIDLVQVNPLQYNLPYWRFLNDVRFELPDIDTDLNPAQKGAVMAALKEYYGESNVLNCITFKTESLKAAIQNAMRGLGYPAEEAMALTSMVPVDRGHVYTMDECEHGNEDLDLAPNPGIVDKIKSYPNLYETVCKIEGLHTNASIHASAVYIFDNGYIAHNSLMRAPNGTPVTAFDMDDTNAMSGLKIDLLYTDAQNKMMKCMDLLLKDGLMEWQGSLRATYNKYLHPDVLNYTDAEMWDRAANGTITNLFQWETAVGAVAIKKARPRSVLEMATVNSAIRVQSEGSIQPIDRYIMFHNDITLWYQEMYNAGLDDYEIEIMREHLLPSSGCSFQQEDFMQLVMDPNISGFTLAQSNKLRKTIAHKVLDQIAEQRDLFFECCDRQHTRKEFARYVWDYCIEPLAKYSFSVIHAVVYSIVAVQEMNLAMFYNPLYWECACLCVNSGNSDTNFDDGDGDGEADTGCDGEQPSDGSEAGKRKTIAPNYGKIARAISNAQHNGVVVDLPSINRAQIDFVPDTANNAIIYGLGAISGVDANLAEQIIANRPFTDVKDFVERVHPQRARMIGLIKAGCFDEIYPGFPRKFIMSTYLDMLAEEAIPEKAKLTKTDLRRALDAGMEFPEYNDAVRVFRFSQYVSQNQEDRANRRYLLTDESVLRFFKSFYMRELSLQKGEYSFMPGDAIAVKQAPFKRVTDKLTSGLMDYLNSKVGSKEYYWFLRNQFTTEMMEKDCPGNESRWEMDTLSYYYNDHVMKNTPEARYGIVDFFSLSERPEDGDRIVAIAGTVVDNNKNKRIVTVLTKHGVVDVKFFSSTYARFNQDIVSVDRKTGVKTKVDTSWFKRGTNIIVYGQRRDNAFVNKTYREGNFTRTVGLINEIRHDGTLSISYTRKWREARGAN